MALVRRGECNFTEKCLRVQAKGAVAVVVYDSQERERCVFFGFWGDCGELRAIGALPSPHLSPDPIQTPNINTPTAGAPSCRA